MRLGELCSSNPLRIPHPKIDKLACQAQGVGIFAKGEITLRDAFCTYLICRAILLDPNIISHFLEKSNTFYKNIYFFSINTSRNDVLIKSFHKI